MIILDTHIWVWWTHGDKQLTASQMDAITAAETDGIGISAISLWEVAKLVEYKRLQIPLSLEEWFEAALKYPGIEIIPLIPEIALESTRLPGDFHKDPADQIIVATARFLDCSLLTSDRKIIDYPHVRIIE